MGEERKEDKLDLRAGTGRLKVFPDEETIHAKTQGRWCIWGTRRRAVWGKDSTEQHPKHHEAHPKLELIGEPKQ